MSLKTGHIYFKPDEAKFIGMAVVSLLEQIETTSKNQIINWNPEARKYFKEMIASGTSLKIKLERLGFNVSDLPPYLDGDENEFLTKQS